LMETGIMTGTIVTRIFAHTREDPVMKRIMRPQINWNGLRKDSNSRKMTNGR